MLHNAIFETVAPMRISQERPIAQASHTCQSPSCRGEQWNVQCLSAHDQLWRVNSTTGGSYLVAGVTPACPWCGADLEVDRESHTEPFINGLLPSMNGSHQPGQAVKNCSGTKAHLVA